MKLTVFTPIYNREELIDKLYESLVNQSCKEFVWLVVDDGSTDNIKCKIEKYAESSPFEIKYIYRENHGKHAAHNTAVAACCTELFFCVDSDDYLTEDAVEKILKVHKNHRNENFLGYYFRKMDTCGNISGGDVNIATGKIGLREIYFKNRFSGELAIVLKTEFIKPYSFPVYDNEKFVSEKVFYNQLDSIAPMLFIDEVIYMFEYQQNGYTMNAERLMAKNPIGAAMGFLSDAVYAVKFIDKIKAYASFKALKKVYALSESYFNIKPNSCFVKLAALALEPHYTRIFVKIKSIYNLEEV